MKQIQVGSPITAPVEAAPAMAPNNIPEFFRLPAKGCDPYFGMTRPYYYEGEKRGLWRLVRLRKPGNARGITLVPFDRIRKYLQSLELEP